MNLLINVLRIALITHKTIAAVAASVVITTGVIDYLRKNRK